MEARGSQEVPLLQAGLGSALPPAGAFFTLSCRLSSQGMWHLGP